MTNVESISLVLNSSLNIFGELEVSSSSSNRESSTEV